MVSQLNVTNGVEVGSEVFPSVVKLVREENDNHVICTGTYISKTLVLTAAHCLGTNDSSTEIVVEKQDQDGNPYLQKPTSFIRHPLYDQSSKISPHDLALLTFENDDMVQHSGISFEAVHTGDPITIVGYGNNTTYYADGSLIGIGSGKKRSGTNLVYTVMPKGIIIVSGVDGTESTDLTPGINSASGNGDSGGALFKGDHLVGVTIGGGLVEGHNSVGWRAISYFVNLSKQENLNFINSMLAETK